MKKIALTQGKSAIVDDEDFEEFSKYKWCAINCGNKIYAARQSSRKDVNRHTIYMHREIMHTPKGMDTDHIDRDGLNNQKKNLRNCTRSQNLMNTCIQKNNTSGFRGVTKFKGKFQARIAIKRKRIDLGRFDTKEKAYEAYIEASKKYHKEFSRVV